MENKKIIPLCILLIIFLIWFIPFIYCETLSLCFAKDFEPICEEFWDSRGLFKSGKIDKLKVLSCNDNTAKVYCVIGENSIGEVITLDKMDDTWMVTSPGKCIWSTSGSANDFVWPYFWDGIRFIK